MRLTSIMKDYIREEVAKRIAPKYEEMKRLQEYRRNRLEEFFEKTQEKLNKELQQDIDEFLQDNPIYIDAREDVWNNKIYVSHNLITTPTDNISNWQKDMKSEIATKVKEIFVTLELGGTKKDLDELLKKI